MLRKIQFKILPGKIKKKCVIIFCLKDIKIFFSNVKKQDFSIDPGGLNFYGQIEFWSKTSPKLRSFEQTKANAM